MTYISDILFGTDEDVNEEHDHGGSKSVTASIHHIAFVTKTLSKLIRFECTIVNQFLHHCHLFYPKYEEITEEDFSARVRKLKDFEIFLDSYRKCCEQYILITDEKIEKSYRNSKLNSFRDELFEYWYRFYDTTNPESFTYYMQYENVNFLILSEKAKNSIELELQYLDFNYRYFLSEFSRIMASLDTNEDSPLYELHLNTIQEDYRHWFADLSFFFDRVINDHTAIKAIIAKSLIPKKTDYDSINFNILKVVSYITKLKNTIKEIYDFIDNGKLNVEDDLRHTCPS